MFSVRFRICRRRVSKYTKRISEGKFAVVGNKGEAAWMKLQLRVEKIDIPHGKDTERNRRSFPCVLKYAELCGIMRNIVLKYAQVLNKWGKCVFQTKRILFGLCGIVVSSAHQNRSPMMTRSFWSSLGLFPRFFLKMRFECFGLSGYRASGLWEVVGKKGLSVAKM